MIDEILDLLIICDYTFKEVAERFELSIAEVKRIYTHHTQG